MAMIRRTVEINVPASEIWDAIRDVGKLHLRVAPGMVADCVLNDEGTERIVTFADGSVLPETIIAVDDQAMRLVWSAKSPAWTHHNGALEVTAKGAQRCSLSWTADVLPDEVTEMIAPLMEAGQATMKALYENGLEPPKS